MAIRATPNDMHEFADLQLVRLGVTRSSLEAACLTMSKLRRRRRPQVDLDSTGVVRRPRNPCRSGAHRRTRRRVRPAGAADPDDGALLIDLITALDLDRRPEP